MTFRPYAALFCVFSLLVAPLSANTRAGDKLFKKGQKAEEQHDYDAALTLYEEALATDSRDQRYMLAEQRVKSLASNNHIDNGKKLLQQQKLNEALVQFNKALVTDPSSMIALQLIQQTNQMIKERNKLPAGTVILTPAEQARADLEKRINELQGPPVLKPINNQISSLKMNNQSARVLYESVGKLAGINVLFDPQGLEGNGGGGLGGGGGRNFNLDLTNVTLEEALNYVALVTHTFWKPVSHNAIFVTSESEQKRQEYQDEVVRVFYIQNASTANEFTEIFNGVRTGAKLQTGIFQVASQNAIIARGTPDTMAIVEKLVHDLDRPKAEVLVDVMIMEVSKSHITNIGAALSGQGASGTVTGLAIPISPATATTSTTGTGTTGTTGTTTTSGGTQLLSQIGHLSSNQFSVALPSALVEAYLTDSNSRLLNRPEVRVTDGGKATLKIGSKIPYVSGSLNSAVATPGSIPYATTQFQQIDVGVNIDLQPHVNGPNDVSMHIKVEVSSVTSTETIGGIQQPIIGQRVNEADLRMTDGEASLLGGLTQDSTSLSVAGIPGIANVPLLGYLFGTKSKDLENDDIIIAMIPHIIRAPSFNPDDKGILAGTERVVKVDRLPAGGEEPPAGVTPQLPPGAQPLRQQPSQVPQRQQLPAQVPPTQPPATTPPTALPPLGRALGSPNTDAPNGGGGATPVVASPNSQGPNTGNQIQLYVSPKPNPDTAPAANPVAAKKPAIDPNAPLLQLTSEVVTDDQHTSAAPNPK